MKEATQRPSPDSAEHQGEFVSIHGCTHLCESALLQSIDIALHCQLKQERKFFLRWRKKSFGG